MESVKCQRCTGKGPCVTCGGYGEVFIATTCPTCAHPRLVRPGAFTIYEGKVMRSVDGVEITYSLDKGDTCDRCPREKRDE